MKAAVHLFSGPMGRVEGLREALRPRDWLCEDWDIVNAEFLKDPASMHDLSADNVWEWFSRDLHSGAIDAIWAGTPCETFSKARCGPPGPRPLRTPESIYGLKVPLITYEEAEQVKLGTYFAIKTANLLTEAHQVGVPWGLENPDPSGNPVSLFNLPEIMALAKLPGVKHVDFDQCMMGAPSAKPTRVLYFNMDLSTWARRCLHPPQMWDYKDWHGNLKRVRAPHMPLIGRKSPDGNFASKAASAYPGELNELIALAIVKSRRHKPEPVQQHR